MGRSPAQRKRRKARNQAAGAEPSPRGADEGSGVAPTVDEAQPRAVGTTAQAQERAPTTRPYLLNHITDLTSAKQFSEWLLEQSGKEVGISGKSGVGIANLEEGWELNLEANEQVTVEIARESLSRVIAANDGPRFITRSLRRDGPVLAAWCDLERDLLSSKVVGDVEVLCRDTGRPDTTAWAWSADDAYDALVTETHWRREASGFYHQISLPRARIQAQGPEDCPEQGQEWRIIYSDLFLRVVAHYTREPVLVRAFMDGLDPVTACALRLDLPEGQEVYAALIWACFGMDTVYLEQMVPDVFTKLPDNLPELKQKLERTLPVLCLGVVNAREDYTRSKQIESLYGRRVRWGVEMGEVYRQRFVSSVEDLLDICLAVLWKSPEGAFVPDQYANPLSRSISIRGRAVSRETFDHVLRSVAELRRPLSVPLAPTILWEGD